MPLVQETLRIQEAEYAAEEPAVHVVFSFRKLRALLLHMPCMPCMPFACPASLSKGGGAPKDLKRPRPGHEPPRGEGEELRLGSGAAVCSRVGSAGVAAHRAAAFSHVFNLCLIPRPGGSTTNSATPHRIRLWLRRASELGIGLCQAIALYQRAGALLED